MEKLASFCKKVICSIFLLMCGNMALAKFDATIPVIDMNDFYSPSRHKIFVQELRDAMQKVGFVAVVNSRVDKYVLDDAYAEAKLFYALPLDYKMRAHVPHLSGQRGYVQSEVAKGQAKKDHKEFYHMTRDYSEAILAKYNYERNIWPAGSNFKPAMQALISALDEYTVLIEQALAEGIGEHKDFFSKMTRHGSYVMRSIHYPANPPANCVWAAAHTDIDLFTILPRATADGLQVKNANGDWVDVIVPDNAFIINAGDMLQNITNGVYKSSVHRVVSKDQNVERFSIVAFIHARPQDQMDPLPKFITKVGKRNFANATAQELLSERLIDLGLSSPELLQQFAKSGAIERLIDVKRASPGAMQALRAANLASPKVSAELEQLENIKQPA